MDNREKDLFGPTPVGVVSVDSFVFEAHLTGRGALMISDESSR